MDAPGQPGWGCDMERVGIKEAAKQMGVSDKTIRRWIRDGKLPAELVEGPYGKEYAIPVTALKTAQVVVDVVKVERPTDPDKLALAVASAVAQAVQAETKALRDQIAILEAQLREANERAARIEEHMQRLSAEALNRGPEQSAEALKAVVERTQRIEALIQELRDRQQQEPPKKRGWLSGLFGR